MEYWSKTISVMALSILAALTWCDSLTTRALAAQDSGVAAPSGWSSTVHFGFGMIRGSSTGFDRVSGSLAFLDITRPLSESLDLGLRSLGEGGRKAERQFYRMGAGPLLSWNAFSNVWIQAAVSFFKETALNSAGDTAYRSEGASYMIGWERQTPLAKRLDLLWGGFYTFHQGGLDYLGATGVQNAATQNSGWGHGVEIALRMSL